MEGQLVDAAIQFRHRLFESLNRNSIALGYERLPLGFLALGPGLGHLDKCAGAALLEGSDRETAKQRGAGVAPAFLALAR